MTVLVILALILVGFVSFVVGWVKRGKHSDHAIATSAGIWAQRIKESEKASTEAAEQQKSRFFELMKLKNAELDGYVDQIDALKAQQPKVEAKAAPKRPKSMSEVRAEAERLSRLESGRSE